MLPAAGIVDGDAAPDARGAVEIEEASAAGACAVLDDEVAVEQDALDFGQRGIVAIQVGPAGLDHADLGIGQIGQRAAEEIRRGQEVGVENSDEFTSGGVQAFCQRAGLVAFAIGAMQILCVEAERLMAFDAGARNLLGLVGGIVEHLNLE